MPTAPMPSEGRRPLVSGNWKMHHDHITALHTVRDLGFRLKPPDVKVLEVSVHPPFTDLRTVQSAVEDRGLALVLGAQHCSEHDNGAFTGEVSPAMLARLGVRYVIVGHSERRRLFGMSDETVAATLRAVLRHEMLPVLCIGETWDQRQEGETEAVLERQLARALCGVDAQAIGRSVIAYEPLWAIGTGQAATPDDAQSACRFIRQRVEAMAGEQAAATTRIQYGGSVSSENTGALMSQPDVDGLLVGGASLSAATFSDVIRAAAACYRSLVAARGS